MASSLSRLRLALGRSALLRPTNTSVVYRNSLYPSQNAFSTAPKAAERTDIPSDATTAGKVLHHFNTTLNNSKSNDTAVPNIITNAHIQALVESCTSTQDLPSLLHAITTFKRTQGYIMDTPTADLLVDKVLSLDSTNNTEAPLWVLENFKPRTGLYYSATVYKLDQALNALHASVVVNQEEEVDEERVWNALENVSTRLIQRKTLQGARGLSKRKKQEYLKCLQVKGGPTQTTVRRVAEIASQIKGVEETNTTFIQPFQAASVSIHPATLAWLEQEQNSDGNDEEGETADESEEQSEEAEAEADGSEEAETNEQEKKDE